METPNSPEFKLFAFSCKVAINGLLLTKKRSGVIQLVIDEVSVLSTLFVDCGEIDHLVKTQDSGFSVRSPEKSYHIQLKLSK